jgi:hypothetical protein
MMDEENVEDDTRQKMERKQVKDKKKRENEK